MREKFWQYFYRLRESGKTIIVTTHYLGEAERCNIVAFMHNGRVLVYGPPRQLKELLGYKRTLIIKTTRQIPCEVLNQIQQLISGALSYRNNKLIASIEDSTLVYRILRLLYESRVEVADIIIKETSLNEVFVKLVSEGQKNDAE
mgnify:CR=1 FL=1